MTFAATTARRVQIGAEVRQQILDHLAQHPSSTTKQAAVAVHLSYETTRHHLAILLDAGHVRRAWWNATWRWNTTAPQEQTP